MVGVDLLTSLIEMLVGNVQGLSLAVGLGVAAHYLGKATLLGFVLRNLQALLIGLGALVVLGVVDVHPGVAFSLLSEGLRVLTGFLPLL